MLLFRCFANCLVDTVKKIEDLDFRLRMKNQTQKNLEDLILKDDYPTMVCNLEKSKRLDLFMGY